MKNYDIFVADDDFEDRALFEEAFLHHERFTLLGILSSGIEVFEEISRKKNVPDILLIDMYMPFFTGIDVVHALGRLGAAPTMMKFIISGTELSEKDNLLNDPYVVFLQKPVDDAGMKALPDLILQTMQVREQLSS